MMIPILNMNDLKARERQRRLTRLRKLEKPNKLDDEKNKRLEDYNESLS